MCVVAWACHFMSIHRSTRARYSAAVIVCGGSLTGGWPNPSAQSMFAAMSAIAIETVNIAVVLSPRLNNLL